MKKEITTKVTMMLKEITDLLETRHSNAVRIVEKMMENQEFGNATQIEYRTSQGNSYKTYQLNKRQSIAVASRLNTPYLMRLIDRLEELEAKQPLAPWDKPISTLESKELEYMEPVFATKAKYALEKLEKERELSLLKLNMDKEAILNREYTLVDGMKVSIVNASKVDLPHSTMTDLLRKHGAMGQSWTFNRDLLEMGIVEYNTHKGGKYIIAEAGSDFGKNVIHGDTYYPRFFDAEFERLLDMVQQYRLEQEAKYQ